MNNKLTKNILYIVVGIFIISALEFEIIDIPKFFAILLGFIGFSAVINGVFGFGGIFNSDKSLFSNKHKREITLTKSRLYDNKGSNLSFYDGDDLDAKFDNLYDLASELIEENEELREKLKNKKYKL